eukprot:gene3144-3613_t
MLKWLFGTKKKVTGEAKVIEDFAKLLREHGETILLGKAKLSLTSQILITLNKHFQQLAVTTVNGQEIFQVINGGDIDDDLAFIFDFIQKAQNLKLVSGPFCHPSPQLCLLAFKSLTVLEIHRVPIVYVQGLHLIAKQIKTLICCRSTSSIKDAIYEFGREFHGVLTLLELETLDLSYNTITTLDKSLKLLPSLKNLNLCHNCLVNADSEYLPPVRYLNLGFNSIATIPKYSIIVTGNLTVLNLRNNNLDSLEGINVFNSLKTLDVSNNCLVSFDDLTPLAQLQCLINLSLKGNPVAFMDKYRLRTISRLSPVVRGEPVSLDGKTLDSVEILCLGKNVEPVPLRSYIPSKPIGRPTTSLINLASSVHELSKELPVRSSTPNRSQRKSRKVREPTIYDHTSTTARPQTSAEIQSTEKVARHSSEYESLERSSMSSRKSSRDDRVIWVHRSSFGEVEVSRSLPDIDYASTDHISEQRTNPLTSLSAEEHSPATEADDSIYDSVPIQASPSSSSGSSVIVVSEQGALSQWFLNFLDTQNWLQNAVQANGYSGILGGFIIMAEDSEDDTDSPTYLVESIVPGLTNDTEEKESLFVILKNSYLVEKDPFTGQVVKLDLNYLREVTPSKNGTLTVSLKFDLLRADRKKRIYLFEDMDSIHEFDEFVERLRPVASKNNDIIKLKVERWQCLKCLTVFEKISSETSFNLCPNCKSSMVVEKEEMSLLSTGESSAKARQIEDGSSSPSLNYARMNGDVTGSSVNSHLSQLTLQVEEEEQHGDVILQRDSSIEIITPFQNGDVSLPAGKGNGNVMDDGDPADQGLALKLNSSGMPSSSMQSVESNTEITPSTKMTNGEGHNSTSRSYAADIVDGLNMKSHFKKMSGSIESMTSSNGRGSSTAADSEPTSRSSTPCPSHELKRPHSRFTSRPSSTVSPNFGSSGSLICINKDDVLRCDHRLKLYFSMDLFKDDGEEFSCMLRCSFMRYDRDHAEECVLLASNLNIYIIRVKEIDSNKPKEWMKLLVKYAFREIKFIDYGYFNQSFRIECLRDFGSYKFIVGDTNRCQKFLDAFIQSLKSGPKNKEECPIITEEPNPRTLSNVRSQIFGLKEDALTLTKRLCEQVAIYTVPSLLKSKKIRIRTHHQCIVGRELVDWLVSRKEAKSRSDAVILMQKLVDVGLVYHVSKELQFEDVDALYKFDIQDNHKKPSSFLRRNTSHESDHSDLSQSSFDGFDMNTDVFVYQIVNSKLEDEDSPLVTRTICMTKTHLFLVDESHQWPLSRLHQPPSFLNQQYKIYRAHRIVDVVKVVYFEDSPCHLSMHFLDELCDSDLRESCWLIAFETIEEMNKLVNFLKTVWEGELKVDLPSEVLPYFIL